MSDNGMDASPPVQWQAVILLNLAATCGPSEAVTISGPRGPEP
jgi:hypothetical protein